MTMPMQSNPPPSRQSGSRTVTVSASARCPWAHAESQHEYHDTEWGVPSHEDRHLFEMLILEGAQAGLSWATILSRRETYREAYENFDPVVVSRYDERKKARLLTNPGIIRNRLKVEASVLNARAFLSIQSEFGSFNNYLWRFVDGSPVQNRWTNTRQLPTHSVISDALSRDLKQRGLKFVGTTICYAFMQATGLVNDHLVSCPRHAVCAKLGKA